MTFQPVESGNAYQQIAEEIERAIVSGELKPGEHLPSERELVERFQVGRSTVREALRLLGSTRLVHSRPGDPRGPRVLALSAEPLRSTMTRFASMQEAGFAAVVQFRMVLESSANLLAALHRTDEHLRAMERANARMRASIDESTETFSQADFEFHQAVARASGNPLLEVCGESIRDSALRLIRAKLVDAPDQRDQRHRSITHHDEVLAAIERNDAHTAAWSARERLYTYYREYVDAHDRPSLWALVDGFQPTGQGDL